MDILKELFGKLWEDFHWFILAMFALAAIWFFQGGIYNESAHNGAYIKPAAPLDSGETYGDYYAGTPTRQKETLNLPEAPADAIRKAESIIQSFVEKSKEAQRIHSTSLLSQGISFDGIASAKSNYASSEYVRIAASSLMPKPVTISGFGLQGTSFDGTIAIPKSIDKTNMILYPGDRAIISSGASPVGGSFRVNECGSYRTGAEKLVPALRKSGFVGTMTYAECVDAHRNDKDFDGGEWRIFLGQSAPIWKDSGDVVTLVDGNGKVVDAIAY